MGYGHGVTLSHGFQRERGTRKVFPNDQLTHVWAQQNQSEGANNRGTLWFRDGWLYSYRTAIARILTAPSGARVMLIRDESFSVTTSQHMPSPSVFDGASFRVPFIGSSEGQTREPYTRGDEFHARNVRVFVTRWQDHAAGLFKIQPARWAHDRERELTSGHWRGDGVTVPASFDEAAKQWAESHVESLMGFRTACLAYCDAFALAYPVEFASESESRKLAETQTGEALARFRRVLDDPKNKRARERAAANRNAKAQKFAADMLARRGVWLNTADSELLDSFFESRGGAGYLFGGGPRAPSFGYRIEGLTKWQARAAESALATAETELGQGEAIRAKEARLEFAAGAQMRERERAQFERWQRGESGVRCPGSYRVSESGGAHVRVRGDLVETSQGASVPLADAIKAFRFAKLIRARYVGEDSARIVWTRNGARLTLGHFQLDHVRADGSFKAGCHFLAWPQIEAAAKGAGLFELEAADTTSHT